MKTIPLFLLLLMAFASCETTDSGPAEENPAAVQVTDTGRVTTENGEATG